MAKKILKVSFPEKCIGCDLCALAAVRQLGKVGIDNSPIRILRAESGFDIHLDPTVNNFDIKEISEICPKGVFEVVEEAGDEILEFKE